MAALMAVFWFTTAVDNLDRGRNREEVKQLEDALRKSCVACYAVEGMYPPSLDYLKEHYGLQIDEKKYVVKYTVFAENLMPDITILEKKEAGSMGEKGGW